MPDRRSDYTNRELEHLFTEFGLKIQEVRDNVKEIKDENEKSHSALDANQKKTNGNVLFHTKVLLVFGAVLGTLLVTNSSELIKVFRLLI